MPIELAGGGEDREILEARATPQEDEFEQSLRPARLADFIGQQALKDNLELILGGAKQRGEPL